MSSINDIFCDDLISYILQFLGAITKVDSERVCKKWNTLEMRNTKIELRKQLRNFNAETEFFVNNTYIISIDKEYVITIQKNNEYFKSFVSNQNECFSKLLESCEDNDLIIVNEGQYIIKRLIINKSVSITGNGIVKLIHENADYDMFDDISVGENYEFVLITAEVYIENVQFVCDSKNYDYACVCAVDYVKLWINNCQIKSCNANTRALCAIDSSLNMINCELEGTVQCEPDMNIVGCKFFGKTNVGCKLFSNSVAPVHWIEMYCQTAAQIPKLSLKYNLIRNNDFSTQTNQMICVGYPNKIHILSI
eukprot:436624_1